MSVIPNNSFKYKNSTRTSNVSISPPPGSIIAYLGTDDPDGWVVCNGTARTNWSDGKYNNLINMSIGNVDVSGNYTPPNYKGAFLRGTGTQSNYIGPSLNVSQTDDNKSHTHTATDSGHSHGYGYDFLRVESLALQSNGSKTKEFVQTNAFNASEYRFNQSTDIGKASITVTSSGTETRPFNYGVNWIIKL